MEVLEQRVMLSAGISPSGAPQINGFVNVALSNVTVATFTVTDPSGSPGTMWAAQVNWGDGTIDHTIPATAGAGGVFDINDSHTYTSAGTFTINVMLAVPHSHSMGGGGTVTTTAVITNQPTLQSIAVTPANPTINKGNTEQFKATGTYSDSSTQDLTSQVTWASAATSVATINVSGLATGAGTGTSKISATLNGITGSTVLTVNPAALVSIAVTPANPSIAKGNTEQFKATGTYTDNSTQDLSSQVTWASATTSVATITAAGLATGSGTGTSSISATLSGVSGSTLLTVNPAALVSIAVTPANPAIAKGNTEQFTATGTYAEPDKPGHVGVGNDLRRHHHRRRTRHGRGDRHLDNLRHLECHQRFYPAHCQPRRPGVDCGHAGKPRNREGEHRAVHRHRNLHR
jgi:hypothetical protein